MFGIQDPTTDSYFGPYLNQIQTSLDNFTQLGSDTLDEIINEVLIRQYAKNNGITVSAEEVSSAVQSEMGYFPNGTQTPTITPTSIIYPTLSSTELALVTLTPIPTPYPTLTPQPTPTLDLAATPTTIPTITPTATPYTQEGFKNAYATVVASYSKLSMNDADIRKVFFENRLYRERVYTVITKDVPHEQDQAWARHILVADEATAKNVINQLFNGGDWQTLAAKYSTDSGSKDNGGDVGWFGKGKMVAEFENAAFTLPVGTISAPVKTTYGYHIIQVLGHEFRPLSESEYKSLTDAKFQEWLKAQRDAATVDISEDYLTKIPTEPTLASATGQ
jgi:parvulin-like peptidyl-prolyl isomerase